VDRFRDSGRKSKTGVAEIVRTWGAAVLRPYMIVLSPASYACGETLRTSTRAA
jgi:hypothetical protein